MSEGKPNEVPQRAPNAQQQPAANNTQPDQPAATNPQAEQLTATIPRAEIEQPAATNTQPDRTAATNPQTGQPAATIPQRDPPAGDGTTGSQRNIIAQECTEKELLKKIADMINERVYYFYFGATDEHGVLNASYPQRKQFRRRLDAENLILHSIYYITDEKGFSKKDLFESILLLNHCINHWPANTERTKYVYVRVFEKVEQEGPDKKQANLKDVTTTELKDSDDQNEKQPNIKKREQEDGKAREQEDGKPREQEDGKPIEQEDGKPIEQEDEDGEKEKVEDFQPSLQQDTQ